jgi:hypothetical protein
VQSTPYLHYQRAKLFALEESAFAPNKYITERGLRSARSTRNADFLCRIESGSLHRRNL